jgi:16S rRNA (adenine1518-N6/adenine1519-N6)-dimethyltransferase
MYAEMRPEIEVPPECFFPPPRIRSTVLTFRMRSRPKCPIRRETSLLPLVKAAFAHRRKTLLNNLRQAGWLNLTEDDLRNRLAESGIDPRRRAETLTPEEYALLTDILTDNKYS